MKKIPRRHASVILRSIGAGVVPTIGLEYIAVGRKAEMEAILGDLLDIEAGGGAFRFIVGRYGSGKSFMLQLTRNSAMARGFLVANADLSPERRLTGAKGQGLALYRELMANLSSKAHQEGNALESVLQRWIKTVQSEVEAAGCGTDDPAFPDEVRKGILQTANDMQEYIYGYDFAHVLLKYWDGYRTEQDELRQSALRWLRGEYVKKTDARALGVSQIITDETWYEAVKLLARLSKKLGYAGLIILIDESVNLSRISNRIARENNYEKLLTMFNDVMQGRTQNLGFFIGGTPEFVENDRRGLYSYEALRSRLRPSRLAKDGVVDFSGPIIRLETLNNEELYLLLERLRDVFCSYHKISSILTQEQMIAFMGTATGRIGADALLTPREISREFVSLMWMLQQNPGMSYETIDVEQRLQSPKTDPDALDDDKYAIFDL